MYYLSQCHFDWLNTSTSPYRAWLRLLFLKINNPLTSKCLLACFSACLHVFLLTCLLGCFLACLCVCLLANFQLSRTLLGCSFEECQTHTHMERHIDSLGSCRSQKVHNTSIRDNWWRLPYVWSVGVLSCSHENPAVANHTNWMKNIFISFSWKDKNRITALGLMIWKK